MLVQSRTPFGFHCSPYQSLVIGKDGEQIQKLEDETGVRFTLKPSGDAAIYAPTADQMQKAKTQILNLQGLTVHEGISPQLLPSMKHWMVHR